MRTDRRGTTARRTWRRLAVATIGAVLCVPMLAIASPADSEQAADLGHLAGRDGGRAQGSEPLRAQAVTNVAGWSDGIGDNEAGLAPDIQAVAASSSDDGYFTVGVALNSNLFVDGDFLAVYVDTDGNAGTGSASFLGADVVFTLLGNTGGADIADIRRWDGVDWVPTAAPSYRSFRSGAADEYFTVRASELGISQGTQVGIYVGSLYSGIYDTYTDFAPEPGLSPFRFTAGAFGPGVPVPPPVATTPPASGGTLPTTPGGTVSGAPIVAPAPRPLVLRTLGLSKVGHRLRVRFAFAAGTGRVLSQLSVSATVNGARREKFIRISSPAGARTITRMVPLPSSWLGTRVTVQLLIGDDYRDISRTKTIRFGSAGRTVSSARVAARAGTAGGAVRCDPNYEGACIPVGGPDLDCADVAASDFLRVGADPHRFDGDGDGIACET